MTKTELIQDMKAFVDGSGWMTVTDLAKYLGYKDRTSARKYVKGIPRIGYKFAIADVADNIMRGLER